MSFNFEEDRFPLKNLWLFLARGANLGLLPFMPGTWGTLGGLVCFIPIHLLLKNNDIILGGAVLFVIAVSFPLSAVGIKFYGHQDPAPVVIDEIAGLFLALYPFVWTFYWPNFWWAYLIGFVFFRLYDALKVFPVNIAERLPGMWGVVMDDLVAGFLANLSLTLTGVILYNPYF
ncbi:MAG: phosphatidylglycerophosphatase A family protein [bacterium]